MSKVSIIFIVNNEPEHMAVVPRTASCAEVRRKWEEASEDPSAVVFIVEDSDGAPLPEEGSVADLLPSGKHALVIFVFREEEKRVRVLGSEREPLTIRLQPQETAKELTARLKVLLGVEERVARLVSGGRVLDAEAPACPQLTGCPMVELDLECSFLAVSLKLASQPESEEQAAAQPDSADEAAAGVSPPAPGGEIEVELLRRFASDTARTLCGDAASRVTFWDSGRSLSGSSVLFPLMEGDAVLTGRPIGVFVETSAVIFVDDKVSGVSENRTVWPTTKFGSLSSCDSDSVIIRGEEADRRGTPWTAGLREGDCLAITRIDTVSVLIEGGKECHFVKFSVSDEQFLFRLPSTSALQMTTPRR